MLLPSVFEKKAKSVGPVIIEGKFLRRTGVNIQRGMIWLDRKIGDGARNLVMPTWEVVENQIMFLPYQHEMACNPKYISDELVRRMPDIQIYWSVNKAQFARMDPSDILARDAADGIVKKKSPEYRKLQSWIATHVHFVRPNSYEYFYAAATSKILVTNSILGDKFYSFPVKKEQHVVETWHGSLGIKRFDPAHYNTNLSWPVFAKWTGTVTTECLSNSTFEEDVFRETFWPDTKILRLGHARNDIFFDNYQGMQRYLRRHFLKEHGLREDTHFALYGPTFRDDHDFTVFDLDGERVVEALEKRFGGTWKLLVRYHDNDRKTNSATRNTITGPDVIDVTNYPDMQELLSFTDVGITDYSSWIYDFVLTGKPGFLFAMDVEKYNDERGFYFKLEDSPFPVSTDTDEIVDDIENFDEADYKERVAAFLSGKGCMDDGHASERIADLFLSWMGKGSEKAKEQADRVRDTGRYEDETEEQAQEDFEEQ